MKKLLITLIIALSCLGGFSQQNKKLSQELLMSVGEALNGTAITAGTPTSGVTYQIGHVGASSDFSASGATSTVNGVVFKADGDAPGAWDGAILRPIHASALTLPNPAYTLSNSGAIPTYGHKGNGSYWAFDGVDDYMTITGQTVVGTGNFSIVTRVRSSSTGFMIASGAAGSILFDIFTDRKIYIEKAGGSYFASTTTVSFDTWYNIAYTRSGTTGTFYINGVSAGTVTDNNNYTTAITLIGKYSTNYYKGHLGNVTIFNYALSASDVAFYSNHANHPKAVDQTATGAVLTSGTLVTGKSYKITDWITNDDFVNVGGTNADGTVFTATGTTPTHWAHSSTVVQQGATLILSPEGMLPGIWRDAYHNIDVAVGTGTTSPRLVKDFGGAAWRFNGTSSYLSLADAIAPQLTGGITVSFWGFLQVAGTEEIMNNGKTKIGLYNGSMYVYRDGTTDAIATHGAANSWNHYIITSTETGMTSIYMDGVLLVSESAGTPAEGTANLTIGKAVDFGYYNGIISDFRIYKTILSAEQIQLSYLISE